MDRRTWIAVFVTGTVLLFFAACDGIPVEVARPGDYFPLDSDMRWEYEKVHTYRCECDDNGLVLKDVVELHVEQADWNGLLYRFEDQRTWTEKMVRKNGNQYLHVPAYAPEFVFLNPTLPVGSVWTTNSQEDEEVVIHAVNITKVIHGTTYTDVIEMKQTHYTTDASGGRAVFRTTFHYYARNVGLIYSIMRYGLEEDSSTIETTLVRHWKI